MNEITIFLIFGKVEPTANRLSHGTAKYDLNISCRTVFLEDVLPKTSLDFSVNPLKPKLGYIIFKNPVRTAKKTQLSTITKISWLMPFKEIIAVYGENHTKP
jgi:hypothetical protein